MGASTSISGSRALKHHVFFNIFRSFSIFFKRFGAQVPLAISGFTFFLMYCHHWGRNHELAHQLEEEEEELTKLQSLQSFKAGLLRAFEGFQEGFPCS